MSKKLVCLCILITCLDDPNHNGRTNPRAFHHSADVFPKNPTVESPHKHLFSGNADVRPAISKIQVLAKLTLEGILGGEQITNAERPGLSRETCGSLYPT